MRRQNLSSCSQFDFFPSEAQIYLANDADSTYSVWLVAVVRGKGNLHDLPMQTGRGKDIRAGRKILCIYEVIRLANTMIPWWLV